MVRVIQRRNEQEMRIPTRIVTAIFRSLLRSNFSCSRRASSDVFAMDDCANKGTVEIVFCPDLTVSEPISWPSVTGASIVSG